MRKNKNEEKKVANIRIIITVLVLILLVVGNIFVSNYNGRKVATIEEAETPAKEDISRTTLEIENASIEDSVLTYLTLGADTNFITNVNGIFGISDSGLQGSFWMHKDSVYVYDYSGKGLSGNFSFNTPPLNCPTTAFPTGNNLFEVTLNNAGTVSKAQETVDISCVAGINALGKYELTGGGDWIAGGNSVNSFANAEIYQNVDSVGVFPFGCDDCTKSLTYSHD